jgi:hypothetical protein
MLMGNRLSNGLQQKQTPDIFTYYMEQRSMEKLAATCRVSKQQQGNKETRTFNYSFIFQTSLADEQEKITHSSKNYYKANYFFFRSI